MFAPDGRIWPVFNVADSAIVCGGILGALLASAASSSTAHAPRRPRTADDGRRSPTGRHSSRAAARAGRSQWGMTLLRRRPHRALPVPDGLEGQRVDQALSRLFGLSRTAAAELADAGAVVVDGRVRGKGDRLSGGSWLEVELPPPPAEPAPPQPCPA